MTGETTAGAREAPLEDLMVAMDVVDTVRHRELLVDRELDAEGRRQRMVARLREIYTAQGIEVTDAALESGVDALEQERFSFSPTPGGLMPGLARIYVRRDHWLKPLLGIAALGLVVWLFWIFSVQLPEARYRAALPAEIETSLARITAISASEEASRQAQALYARADRAVADEEFDTAERLLGELQALQNELQASFEIRIVSRPDQMSGVWRIPDVNEQARNYYLIVEAVDPRGTILKRPVRNEETGRTREVQAWGLRVNEQTFEAVASDKRDDGIIQDYIIGSKATGKLEPSYRVPTTGATITEW